MDIEEECVDLINNIIVKLDLPLTQITWFQSLQLLFYVEVTRKLRSKTETDHLVCEPLTVSDEIHNVDCLLKLLRNRKLQVHHIIPFEVVRRNLVHTSYILNLIHQLMEQTELVHKHDDSQHIPSTVEFQDLKETNNGENDEFVKESKDITTLKEKLKHRNPSVSKDVSVTPEKVDLKSAQNSPDRKIEDYRTGLSVQFLIPTDSDDTDNTEEEYEHHTVIKTKTIGTDAKCSTDSKQSVKSRYKNRTGGVIINHDQISAEVSFKHFQAQKRKDEVHQLAKSQMFHHTTDSSQSNLFEHLSEYLPFAYLSGETRRQLNSAYMKTLKNACKKKQERKVKEVKIWKEICGEIAKSELTRLHLERDLDVHDRLITQRSLAAELRRQKGIKTERKIQHIRAQRYLKDSMSYQDSQIQHLKDRDESVAKEAFENALTEYEDHLRNDRMKDLEQRIQMLQGFSDEVKKSAKEYCSSMKNESVKQSTLTLVDSAFERQRTLAELRRNIEITVKKTIKNLEEKRRDEPPFRSFDAMQMVSDIRRGHIKYHGRLK